MTRPDIQLRVATEAEAVEIALMSRDLIEDGLRWAWTPRRVVASMRSRQTNVLVARVNDELAGLGIMRYDDNEAHLDLLAVARKYRRHGLGRRILEWLEKPAIFGGLRLVLLEVRARNYGAQAFYRRLGYRQVAYVSGYYQGLESAVRMRRVIGGHLIPSDSNVDWLDESLRRIFAAGSNRQ